MVKLTIIVSRQNRGVNQRIFNVRSVCAKSDNTAIVVIFVVCQSGLATEN